ncbi:MAG: hypothetical protein ABIG96_02715 [Candidatus Micrarchaeota archaeon]
MLRKLDQFDFAPTNSTAGGYAITGEILSHFARRSGLPASAKMWASYDEKESHEGLMPGAEAELGRASEKQIEKFGTLVRATYNHIARRYANASKQKGAPIEMNRQYLLHKFGVVIQYIVNLERFSGVKGKK